jgi:hypothetical protein
MLSDLDVARNHWPSANAFYLERDTRTELEVAHLTRYVHVPIEIHVEPQLATDVTIQRMVLLAANLTARWARNVRVLVPEVDLASPLSIHGDRGLRARVIREMFEADPFGNFEVGTLRTSDSEGIRLRVGLDTKTTFPATENDYWIDAALWTALGRRGRQSSRLECRDAAAPTAALAAAIGAADLFKRAVDHRLDEWIDAVDWCTWNHTINSEAHMHAEPALVPSTADVGELLLAGVGAVGSALLYILSSMPLQGRVTLLDRDCVETSNLNRAPLFTALDASLSRRKTDVGLSLMRLLNCEAKAVYGSWHKHGEELSRERFDVWVSLTNEGGAWAEVPFQLPPVVLHGTTTSGWGIGFGRHIPRLEDCTACRLPRPHAEFRGPCSEGEVRLSAQREPIRASLPFLSAASASLIAIELIKLQCPNAGSLPNAVCADFRYGLPSVVAGRIGPTNGCRGCQMAGLAIWNERGGRGRYASLSSHLDLAM